MRVVVADDHALFRVGLKSLLEELPGVNLVGVAADGEELLKLAAELQPDLVIVDHEMPAASGMDAIVQLQARSPEIKCIVLTGIADEKLLFDFDELGVDGLVLKSEDAEDLVQAIEKVRAGGRYLSNPVSGLINRATQVGQLTGRERQVIRHIAQGMSAKEMSQVMGVSPKTIDNHRTNLMKKLDLHNAAEVVAFAIRSGLA